MAKFVRKKGVNIGRVVAKVAGTVIALYAGGTVVQELGSVMNCTYSPFYDGLSLIGWTVSDLTDVGTTCTSCGGCNATLVANAGAGVSTVNNVITATGGSGILAVIGIIGIASIVMEFVSFKM